MEQMITPDWSQRAEEVVARLIAGLPISECSPALNHAVRLGTLHIGEDLWSNYYLRPRGEVIVVGEAVDQPDVDTIHTDRSSVLRALIWGAQRHPQLRELLPRRPPGAVDCRCAQVPMFAEGRLLCSECNALGWLPPQNVEVS